LKSDTIVYSILFKDEEGFGHSGGFGGPGGMGGRHGEWGGPGVGGPGMGRGRYPQQRESRPDGKKVLEQISRQTGGRMFEVSKKMPLEKIYEQIEEELRNQYNLGFTPTDKYVGYHRITLITSDKNSVVQAREGYYAKESAAQSAAK
jgi:VWFA-related protein